MHDGPFEEEQGEGGDPGDQNGDNNNLLGLPDLLVGFGRGFGLEEVVETQAMATPTIL